MLLDYNETLQKKFLLFTTGTDRVPVGGMTEMTFKISKLKVCNAKKCSLYRNCSYSMTRGGYEGCSRT